MVPALLARAYARLGDEALAFGLLRALTLISGIAALVIAPLRPEHELHLAPLLGGFVVYNAVILSVLARRIEDTRRIFLATLAADLALVFVLVWFTGGGSPFYLLFYLLVALNAYYFGRVIGASAAFFAAGLLAGANWLAADPASWTLITSRGLVLLLLGVTLGHVASRERTARAQAERLNREMETAMARLARAEQLAAVGRMSAKMAHEVRNPLGAINLNVDLLREIAAELPPASSSEARELIDGIQSEVRALAEMTDEYLLASRLPSPKLERGSVNELVGELIGFFAPVASRSGVRLSADLHPAVPAVSFDRAMLRLAVRNLVKNSIEALHAGGEIRVLTRVAGEEVAITVADDGPGIAREAAGRLLEPFFTTKPGGTGLGLSIAEEIAREHRGRLTWSSEPGSGARFTISLPRASVEVTDD